MICLFLFYNTLFQFYDVFFHTGRRILLLLSFFIDFFVAVKFIFNGLLIYSLFKTILLFMMQSHRLTDFLLHTLNSPPPPLFSPLLLL